MDAQDMYKRSKPADEVLPGLWLGNRHAAADAKFAADKKIRAVFNCSKDIPFNPAIPRQYRVPVDDSRQEPDIGNLEKWSYEIVYKISHEMRRAKQEGSGVLVHCAAGMQRSAASVAMYMIATQGVTADQAMAFIRSKREIAFFPEANFDKSIRGFEASFNREVRPKLSQHP
jgi:hypothetical protein